MKVRSCQKPGLVGEQGASVHCMSDQFIALTETSSPHSDQHRQFGLVVDDRSRVRDLVRAAGRRLRRDELAW